MRHKLFKRLSLFCTTVMVAAVTFLPNTLVYGAPEDKSIYADVVEDADTVTDTSTILTKGNLINYGTVTMTRVSSTRVRITGITQAHRVCDTLGLDLFLYKSSDGENFSNYRKWPFTKKNDDILGQTLEVIVPSGYWYRLGGGHVAVLNGDGESTTTMTNRLYVN